MGKTVEGWDREKRDNRTSATARVLGGMNVRRLVIRGEGGRGEGSQRLRSGKKRMEGQGVGENAGELARAGGRADER